MVIWKEKPWTLDHYKTLNSNINYAKNMPCSWFLWYILLKLNYCTSSCLQRLETTYLSEYLIMLWFQSCQFNYTAKYTKSLILFEVIWLIWLKGTEQFFTLETGTFFRRCRMIYTNVRDVCENAYNIFEQPILLVSQIRMPKTNNFQYSFVETNKFMNNF